MPAAATIKLTPTQLERLPFTTTGQQLYRFDDPRGLWLIVGRKTKTFLFRTSRGGRTQKLTLGHWPGTKADAVRAAALDILADLERGKGLQPSVLGTLGAAVESYLQGRKGRLETGLSPRTAKYTRELMRRYLLDWQARPLLSITGAMIVARHRDIGKAHGEATANDTMRKLRVVFNYATADNDNPPANPVAVLGKSRKDAWFKTRRRTDHIEAKALANWWSALLSFRAVNEGHADLLALLLFTGMRRGEACALEWGEVNLDDRTITLPAERTKQRRAHTVYLSQQACAVLEMQPARTGWVFPSGSASGHITEPRWMLDNINEAAKTRCTIHGLRRTFVTIAESCAVSPMGLKALIGHAASDVTETYVQVPKDALRRAADTVGDAIERHCYGD